MSLKPNVKGSDGIVQRWRPVSYHSEASPGGEDKRGVCVKIVRTINEPLQFLGFTNSTLCMFEKGSLDFPTLA